jgi:hypothetical protein
MANTILTPTAVTREAARVLHQKLNFVGNVNRQYDDSYKGDGAPVKGKFGPTLKIRLPNEYTVRTGVNMSAQDTSETSVDLTVSTVKGVDMYFTSSELALSLEDFSERIISPAMAVLAANIEADALSMYKQVYNLYDGDGAAFAFASMTGAKQILTDNLAPQADRRMLLNTTHSNKFLVDTKGLFNAQEALSKQFREGMMGRTIGFDVGENTLLVPHTTGTAVEGDTSYDCNTSTGITSGTATITVSTGSTTFLIGDVITIAGVNRVHPETKADTGVAQQFVITADSGASATSLSVSPTPVTSGARQNIVINSAGASKAVTKVGAGASETLVQSLAFHKDAFAFVTADLPLPDGTDWARREVVDGISVSLVRDFNISDRSFPCRLDVLYGYKAIRPQLAARVHNDG